MYLKNLSLLEGPNIYSYRGVARATVDISPWGQGDSRSCPDVTERLLKCLPGLWEHRCSRGRRGGFVERMQEGTLAGHILEHVALELLGMAGQDVGFGKTRVVDDSRCIYDVVIGYECREAALIALQEGCALLNRFRGIEAFAQENKDDQNENIYDKEKCKDELAANCPLNSQLDEVSVSQAVKRIEQGIERFALGPSTQHVLECCRQMNVPVRLYQNSLMRLGYGCRGRWMRASMSERDSCVGTELAQNKELTRRILRESGLPVPVGTVVRSEAAAREFFQKMGRPVVIKPCSGNQGRNVFIGLAQEAQVVGAFRLAAAANRCVLAEEFVEGQHYRLLMIDGVLAAAARKEPAKVVGDGRSTLAQLIEGCNEDPDRGVGHGKMLTKVKLGQAEIFDLACRGWNLEMIPEEGCEVVVCSGANLSTGGTARDVTDLVHEGYSRMAGDAVRCLGLSVAGVDMVMPDICEFNAGKVKILEVNAAPGLRMHLPSSLGQRLVGSLFPDGQARIPVVAVTGSNGKSTVVRMVAQGLALNGCVTGLTCSDGVYVDGEKILDGDRTGPESARCVLAHPRVEVAVLETARGGILRGGLGYDWADVAVVTNVTGDHLGEYGVETLADLLRVKGLVAERVPRSGYVVLNADDGGARKVADHVRASVIYFSRDPDNRWLKRHLAVGGKGVLFIHNKIVLAQGNDVRDVEGDHLQYAMREESGRLPPYLVENMLAAVGAAWALGQPHGSIVRMLREFKGVHNPGRWEAYTVDVNVQGESKPLRVVLDYAHNPVALRAVAEGSSCRLIGCIGMPGNRRDEDIVNFGRIAGEFFESVYIKEDEDLRGRRPGEVAKLMKQGVASVGGSRVRIMSSEAEALHAALREAHRCMRKKSGNLEKDDGENKMVREQAGEQGQIQCGDGNQIKGGARVQEDGDDYTVLICYEHLGRVRECLQRYNAQRCEG